MEGFTTPETHNKWSLRASKTGELVFNNVKVPKENLLPGVTGLKGPLSCLNSARYGISWGVIGCSYRLLLYGSSIFERKKTIRKTNRSISVATEKISRIFN